MSWPDVKLIPQTNKQTTVFCLTEKWTEDMSRAALETEPEVFGADLPSPPSLDPDALNFLMQIATGSLNEPAYTVYAAMNEYAQSKGNTFNDMAFLSVMCIIKLDMIMIPGFSLG